MADLSFDLEPDVAERLRRHIDVEGKLLRGLDALGPVAGRDVVVLSVTGASRWHVARLAELGARAREVPDLGAESPASADVVLGLWSAFRGVQRAEVEAADRVLRPSGRLLVVHDYGRDDVSRLRSPELPEYGPWSRRDGPFLRGGFRVRVIHCWWTFEAIDEAALLLADAFGPPGAALGEALKRPRLSYNVAIYHRGRPDDPTS